MQVLTAKLYWQIGKEIGDRKYRKLKVEKFAKDLSAIKEPLVEFDEEIFHEFIQEVRIGSEDDVEVVWRDGMAKGFVKKDGSKVLSKKRKKHNKIIINLTLTVFL